MFKVILLITDMYKSVYMCILASQRGRMNLGYGMMISHLSAAVTCPNPEVAFSAKLFLKLFK